MGPALTDPVPAAGDRFTGEPAAEFPGRSADAVARERLQGMVRSEPP